VRPVHRLTALLDDQIIPLSLLGLQSDRITKGHRFLAPGQISLSNAVYADALREQGKVIASFANVKNASAAHCWKSRRRSGTDAGIAAG
jgi:glycyl-tRNA synthetase beta chain